MHGDNRAEKHSALPRSCAIQRTDEVTVLRFQLVHRRPLRDIFAIIGKPHPAFARYVVEVVRETVRSKPARIDLLIHQKVLLVLDFAVHRAALFLDFQDAVAVLVVHTQIAPPKPCRDTFEDMYQKRVVPSAETEVLVEAHKAVERPFGNHLFYRIERQSEPLITGGDNMDDITKIACVRAPGFRPLLVRENLDEREVVYRGGVTAHFQPRIEQVVLLIGLVRTLPDLFEFQIVSALLADLCDGNDAELEASGFGIVLNDFLPEPKDIEIEDMRVPSVRNAFREKVVAPHGKVPSVSTHIVRTDGIVRHNEAALNNVDEVGLRIRFQHVKEELHFEGIVERGAVSADIVTVELPIRIAVTEVP